MARPSYDPPVPSTERDWQRASEASSDAATILTALLFGLAAVVAHALY